MEPMTWALMAGAALVIVLMMCVGIWVYDKRQAEEVSHESQRLDPGPSVKRNWA